MSKYVIDDSTLTSIAEAIRGKTGSTDPIAVTDMAAQIASITGGGSADEVILEEQSVVFIKSDIDVSVSLHAQNPIVIGETYKVSWDGTEYECTAAEMEGIAFMGNLLPVGGEDNGVPFAMVCVIDGGVVWLDIVSVYETTASTHIIAIFHKASGGGGSIDGVCYVTFKNWDGTDLVTKPVFIGDHCTDPVDIEQITEPTRESTNTEVFTHSGWALTSGGEADASALLNVDTDRTVYAAYKVDTRLYTINFFDGEDATAPMHTVLAEYGSTPSYEPTRDDKIFDGWNPAIVPVVGDADYYAVWAEKLTFANASWEQINEICMAGQSADYFAVGDTKEITVDSTVYTVRIIGLNMDTHAYDGYTLGITAMITPVSYSHINGSSSMATSWGSSHLSYKWLTNTFKPSLPAELRSVMKTVVKQTALYHSGKSYCGSQNSSMFIPSAIECGGTVSGPTDEHKAMEIGPYPGLDTKDERIITDVTGKAVSCWLRNINNINASYLGSSGSVGSIQGNTNTLYTLPCFCI